MIWISGQAFYWIDRKWLFILVVLYTIFGLNMHISIEHHQMVGALLHWHVSVWVVCLSICLFGWLVASLLGWLVSYLGWLVDWSFVWLLVG